MKRVPVIYIILLFKKLNSAWKMLTAINLFLYGIFHLMLFKASAQECSADGQLCDTHERCPVWKEDGECFKNEAYMKKTCPMSCLDENYPTKNSSTCKDHHIRCPVWASLGECDENPRNMKRFCPLSCNICSEGNLKVEDDVDQNSLCVDKHEQCSYWASKGECPSNPVYMHANCAKSCGTCGVKVEKVQLQSSDAELTDEEKSMVDQTAEFGEKQLVSGTEYLKTLEIVRKSVEYMKNQDAELSESVLEKCRNANELCSFWASLGECEKNEAFMELKCAPACNACDLMSDDDH
mmetsp:Transcript_9928/g.15257  ORF Transcript_9928/g.15257 Transcript_9928/m.15257 type:complete len:294 (-) Transcript_9928:2041-2922(-)